jgi:hypothetical protein
MRDFGSLSPLGCKQHHLHAESLLSMPNPMQHCCCPGPGAITKPGADSNAGLLPHTMTTTLGQPIQPLATGCQKPRAYSSITDHNTKGMRLRTYNLLTSD